MKLIRYLPVCGLFRPRCAGLGLEVQGSPGDVALEGADEGGGDVPRDDEQDDHGNHPVLGDGGRPVVRLPSGLLSDPTCCWWRGRESGGSHKVRCDNFTVPTKVL